MGWGRGEQKVLSGAHWRDSSWKVRLQKSGASSDVTSPQIKEESSVFSLKKEGATYLRQGNVQNQVQM